MDAFFPCPHCSKPITPDAGGRIPPWCRHCGADFKSAAPTQAAPPPLPSGPPITDVTDRPAPAPIEPVARTGAAQAIPYFHAYEASLGGGANDLYRIYITEFDLLVFKLGPGSISHGQVVPQTRTRAAWGTVGTVGVVGAIAAMRAAERVRQAEWMRELLETADEEELRERAWARDGGYAIGPDDLAGEIRIDPPSFWHRLINGADQEGVVRFYHRGEGKKVLALPSAKDVRGVAEGLTRLFGEAVRINLPWAAGANLTP